MKCLITKLEGIVENDSILKLGELRIPCYGNGASVTNKINSEGGLISCRTKPVVFNIIGDSDVTFTDGSKTLDSTKGTNEIKSIATDKEFVLQCLNKYSICVLRLTRNTNNVNVKEDFDVSTLNCLPSLEILEIDGCAKGDLNTIASYEQLTTLSIARSKVFCKLSNITKTIKNLSINNSPNVTGSIGELKAFNFSDMNDWGQIINHSSIDGDLADIPPTVCYINLPDVPVTWSKGKRNNANFLAINTDNQKGFATALDIDNMFIDQSTCNYNGSSLPNQHGGGVHMIKIKCLQSYTPSAEAKKAIKKLYGMGITDIYVNNESMEQYKNYNI